MSYVSDWRKKHPKRFKEIQKKSNLKRRQELKSELYILLGGKCSNPNCLVPNGCSDWRCLQIDHVNGKGMIDRLKKTGNKRNCGREFYRKVLVDVKLGSKEYQLLCANCNWIKKN